MLNFVFVIVFLFDDLADFAFANTFGVLLASLGTLGNLLLFLLGSLGSPGCPYLQLGLDFSLHLLNCCSASSDQVKGEVLILLLIFFGSSRFFCMRTTIVVTYRKVFT